MITAFHRVNQHAALRRDGDVLNASNQLEFRALRGRDEAPDVQVQVLHIVQEALSNVRKHAGATHVELRVTRTPCWRFEVQDDGRGFEADKPIGDESHVGLRIMQERAQRIGAKVQVTSAPGQGCTVALELPPREATADKERTMAAVT